MEETACKRIGYAVTDSRWGWSSRLGVSILRKVTKIIITWDDDVARMGRKRLRRKFVGKNLRERDHLGEVLILWKVMLKSASVLKMMDRRSWTGLIWLKTETRVGI
jgi:hypothetical protein